VLNSPVSILPAQLSDAGEIARLNGLFNGSSEPSEAYLPRLADPRRVDTPLLAWLDGQAVGIANLRLAPSVFYPEPYAELSELFVEEAYRRRGVGRALILYAEALARQAGASELAVLTDHENHAALGLYRSLGYERHDLALRKELIPG
jgi:ribosomal protein S18 acetylase RimI-like enzyme